MFLCVFWCINKYFTIYVIMLYYFRYNIFETFPYESVKSCSFANSGSLILISFVLCTLWRLILCVLFWTVCKSNFLISYVITMMLRQVDYILLSRQLRSDWCASSTVLRIHIKSYPLDETRLSLVITFV